MDPDIFPEICRVVVVPHCTETLFEHLHIQADTPGMTVEEKNVIDRTVPCGVYDRLGEVSPEQFQNSRIKIFLLEKEQQLCYFISGYQIKDQNDGTVSFYQCGAL